ncbi:MAG: thiamine-phosphate kinase [Gammaproteobacteria bacterium]
MGEFDLIRRHFQRASAADAPVVLGVGDDCALLQPTPGHQIAVSSDMLVEGRHFFAGADPQALGHKALAVNLSDLAAMGARPLGFTLALALPQADDAWLAAFARGLFSLADRHHCPLVGGDTTRGPLNLCITVLGELLPGKALRRDGARPGDDLWISGRLGEARLALERRLGSAWALDTGPLACGDERLDRPEPRLALGGALAGVAHAAIDISDGLSGDLGHILAASRVGARVQVDALPLSPDLARLPPAYQMDCMINGGDDYELLFCAPRQARAQIVRVARDCHTPVTRIGSIQSEPGLVWVNHEGIPLSLSSHSFDHFA